MKNFICLIPYDEVHITLKNCQCLILNAYLGDIIQIRTLEFCFSEILGAPVIEYDKALRDQVSFKAGTSLILMVNIRGSPLPTAKWYRDQDEILSGRSVNIEGDGTFSR